MKTQSYPNHFNFRPQTIESIMEDRKMSIINEDVAFSVVSSDSYEPGPLSLKTEKLSPLHHQPQTDNMHNRNKEDCRRKLRQSILWILQNCIRETGHPNTLAHLVRRIDSALFESSQDLNEYTDTNTLEARVRAVLDQMTSQQTELKTTCGRILAKLMNHTDAWIFNAPVDPQTLGISDYFDIIEKPMDLGTIRSRLECDFYPDFNTFDRDISLTFNNCIRYNGVKSPVSGIARNFLALYKRECEKSKPDSKKRRLSYTKSIQTGLSDRHIRTRQQRLLLLFHGAKCSAAYGQCGMFRNCHLSQQLWKHVEKCQISSCMTPHCRSSKSVLRHYKKCKGRDGCLICKPLAETLVCTTIS